MASSRLLGKVAVVTGGASGASCIPSSDTAPRSASPTFRTTSATAWSNHDGSDATYCRCDVAVEEDVKHAVDLAVGKYGGLDIMVNNAGVAGSFVPDIHDTEVSNLERVLDVNVKGVFAGMKNAARAMIPRRRGSIVSMCSITGVTGGGPHPYTASKHAVLGLTRSAAAELGQHGIRVNCVSPYCIITGMASAVVPEDRRSDEEKILAALEQAIVAGANLKGVALMTDDVADAVVFLASDEAKYVSEMNLVVDGGVTAVTNAFRVTWNIELQPKPSNGKN